MTPRRIEVLTALIENDGIASVAGEVLGLAEKTVHNHVDAIRQVFNVSGLLQVVLVEEHHGFIGPYLVKHPEVAEKNIALTGRHLALGLTLKQTSSRLGITHKTGLNHCDGIFKAYGESAAWLY